MRRARAGLLWLAVAAGCRGDAASGPNAADAGHQRMLRELEALAARATTDNVFFAESAVQRRLDDLRRSGAAAPWRERLDAALGAVQMGREREGIELLAAAREALQSGRLAGDANAALSISFYLAVAWLRLGETENCCARVSAESCILPLRGGAVHTAPEGSRSALPFLLEVLHNSAPESYWHLSARWLLNLAHMTLGTHPDGVPAPYRMAASRSPGDGGFPSFANVAPELGVDTFGNAGGAVVDDFDGDGRLDILVSDWAPRGRLRLFRSTGRGFEDVSQAAGLAGLHGGLNLVQADYDGDGHLDFLVLRGAWLFEQGRHPNSLVRNRGDGTFVDVTFAAGLGAVHWPTQTAAFADYDLDGDLDLYVGNESTDRLRCPSQLFRNNGDGTFTDVAAAAGVTNDRFAKAVAWGDVDGDGWPDLYVSNLDGDNRLYRNRGDGTFVDVAAARGVTGPPASFPAWFWDFDNDGALDLFVANYDTGIGHIAAHVLGLPVPYGHPRLYRGDGRGGFTEVAQAMGLDYPSMPMGSNFGDLDGDGFLDVYLGTGDPHLQSLMPNLVYHNQRGRGFRDVTLASGMGHLQKGHGTAIADLDGDGDLDVFAVIGGAYRGDAFHDVLFENPGFGNRWLTVRLRGGRKNRDGIGARLHLVVHEDGAPRSIHRQVGSGGSFGGSPLRQTIGLGRADRIERLEITWPGTAAPQVVTGLPLDAAVLVVEGDAGWTQIEHVPTPFRRR
ncbi:MAG: CRTAC1 family protein [Planctomycetes bacterium]|nr:CRTAC1 family protein [Planctomycetota bacterium]